jgi:Dolichyl-phosphate-mannose-protein mannosyltransferase
MPGLAGQPLRPRTDHVVADLPAVVPQPDDEDAQLQQRLATLALRRAWGQISQHDFAIHRAIALGHAPPPRPTLRQRWDRLRATRNEPRVVLTVQPQPGDNDEALQSILDELALQRAWGQISQRDLAAQRAVVFELLRHPHGSASSRMAATSLASREDAVLERVEDRIPQFSLEAHLAELGRQQAFGQISQRDFEARRAVLLGPRGMASARLSKYWRAAQDEARVSWTPQRLRGAASAKRSLGLWEWSGLARAGASWLVRVRALLRRLVTSRDFAVQLPLLAAVGAVQAKNMLHWPLASGSDEGTYTSWEWAFQTHGVLTNYTYTYGHPPLAWILISLWTRASAIWGDGAYAIDNGREFMLVVSIVSCSLLYVLARRLGMGRAFAASAVLLFALSPLSLYFHRSILLDNPAIAWVLAAFVLALTPKHRLWAFAASGACFAAAVLSKETTLLILPALLLAAAQNADRRTRRYCLTLVMSFFGVIVLVYPLYAALKGELLPGPGHVSILGYAGVQLITRQTSGSVLDPHSLGHGFVALWLQLDPWLVGAALLLSPIALFGRNTRAVALAYVIQVAVIFRPGYLPIHVRDGAAALRRAHRGGVRRRPVAETLALLALGDGSSSQATPCSW